MRRALATAVALGAAIAFYALLPPYARDWFGAKRANRDLVEVLLALPVIGVAIFAFVQSVRERRPLAPPFDLAAKHGAIDDELIAFLEQPGNTSASDPDVETRAIATANRTELERLEEVFQSSRARAASDVSSARQYRRELVSLKGGQEEVVRIVRRASGTPGRGEAPAPPDELAHDERLLARFEEEIAWVDRALAKLGT